VSHVQPQVGLIGLGRIGMPLAQNLISAGYSVSGFRRTDAADFTAAGGDLVGSPAAVADQAEIVISCLPDADALAEVISGPKGVIRSSRPGVLVVEMSTLPVAIKERQRLELVAVGGDLLDAPISGTPEVVSAGRGVLFTSGDESSYARVQPVLAAAVGERVFHVGPFGTGMKLKLAANALVAVHTAAAAEMLAFAEACGLDSARTAAIIGPSAAGSGMLIAKGQMMAARTFDPAPGPVATLYKDAKLIAASAREVGADMPLFGIAERLLGELMADGRGDQDTAALITKFPPSR
jgi:L-threonate 2-dehydrogenase